jgi:hypothetical protein
VKFGFKAPVAMTLVPWWLDVTDRLMFLHVLRDGRDIAFSANQGPVSKFYAPMYAKRINEVPTGAAPGKAIKLWADWNNGLRAWAEEKRRQQQQLGGGGGGGAKQFDYLPVHIEDLVHSSDRVRLDAIARVARFVGSGECFSSCLLQSVSQSVSQSMLRVACCLLLACMMISLCTITTGCA